ASQCPDGDCGPRVRTVYLIGAGGRILDSEARFLMRGQPGWDGSQDGTYRRGEEPQGDYSISWGGSIFNRVSDGDFAGGLAFSFAPQDGKDLFKLKLPAEELDKFGRSAKFRKCVDEAGLKHYTTTEAWKNGYRFNDEGVQFLNAILQYERIDPGLLAFTFMEEGTFDINRGPNKNFYKNRQGQMVASSIDKWDYGPFQLNYNWTLADIRKPDYSDSGIGFHNAVGFFGPNTGFSPLANGRLAARKLAFGLRVTGSERGAAGYFTQGGREEIRRKHWDDEGKRFKAFMACYNSN
nr:hypothetical protein [Chloroflexota bacterium]